MDTALPGYLQKTKFKSDKTEKAANKIAAFLVSIMY